MDVRVRSESVSARAKDPFAENPLPKPFYYPSPTKDINEHEAICSPGWSRRKPLEEKLVQDNFQLSTSALPLSQTLDNHGHDLTSIADSHLDETWPNSEKNSSFSLVRTDVDTTLGSECAGGSSQHKNIADIVRNLENLSSKYKASKGGMNVKDEETSESVLKRYIERFRHSDPKPREERLKENEKTKRDFWWLQSSPGSIGSKTDPHDVGGDTQLRKVNQKEVSESQTKHQLTKEALLAMDEETMKLQQKADKLLSQSASSLSSGPIVSTDGLGSSTAVSEVSSSGDQPPYRPSFMTSQEVRRENPSWVPGARVGIDSHSGKHHAPGDDILLRWRLSRKLDSSCLPPSRPGLSGAQGLPLKSFDPRLEEFRKKLLYQKALVTKEDICFERQRMAMLLEDEDAINKKLPEPQKDVATLQSDPILERMSKITNHLDSVKPPMVTALPVTSYTPNSRHQCHDVNCSNAESRLDHELSSEQVNRAAEENKNNTASSGDHHSVRQTNYVDSSVQVSIDLFGSQVICDPNEKKYTLHSSNLVSDRGDAIKSSQETSAEDSRTRSGVSQSSIKHTPVREEEIGESGDSIETTNGQTSEQKGFATKVPLKNQVKKHEVNYHQFLEAEKPIDELNESQIRRNHPQKRHVSDENSSVKFSSFSEGNQKARDGVRSGKKVHKAQGNQSEDVMSSGSSDVSVRSGVQSDVSSKSTQRSDFPYKSTHRSNISEHSKVNNPDQKKERKLDHSTRVVEEKEDSKNSGIIKTKTLKRHEIADSLPSILKPSQSSESSPTSLLKHPVNTAIGQTVKEQMFEGHSLFSSVDSWASMFPQSPGPVHSLRDSHQTRSPSPRGEQTSNHKMLQSTPIDRPSMSLAGPEDSDDCESDGEYSDDPLLLLLREQRSHFLKLLQMIELKLQEV